jgi:hypothetical protein
MWMLQQSHSCLTVEHPGHGMYMHPCQPRAAARGPSTLDSTHLLSLAALGTPAAAEGGSKASRGCLPRARSSASTVCCVAALHLANWARIRAASMRFCMVTKGVCPGHLEGTNQLHSKWQQDLCMSHKQSRRVAARVACCNASLCFSWSRGAFMATIAAQRLSVANKAVSHLL